MTSLKIVSFFLGLTCSIVAAARYRSDMTPMELMMNPFFIGGLVVAVVSLLLWRQDLKKSEEMSDADSESAAGTKILENLCLEIEQVESSLGSLSREDLLSKLSSINERFMIPFIEQRSELEKKFDMSDAGDILLKFAYGERMLNRAYSCSADGFSEESKTLLPAAKQSFQECLSMMSQ